MTDAGEIVDRRIATTRDQFARLFPPDPPMRVLLEASTEREWVAQCLEAGGHEVIVADPNYAPMYGHRTRRIKTDRRDVAALPAAALPAGPPDLGDTARRPAPPARAAAVGAHPESRHQRAADDAAQ